MCCGVDSTEFRCFRSMQVAPNIDGTEITPLCIDSEEGSAGYVFMLIVETWQRGELPSNNLLIKVSIAG